MTERRHLRFIIMGAGMAGILAGIKLREAGYSDVTIYEKADRIGGTWRENTYPGLTCDVPSHAYTYSFALNPDWSHQLPPGAEIQAYFEKVVRQYRVEDMIRFNQEITECHYRDGSWHIVTAAGLEDSADFVIAATGVLHHPKRPDIAGLASFGGALFHSARWDHSVPLDGRRIGVIGNGSTGVQIVSALVSRAGSLKHFQRTPQWIMPVVNERYSEEQKAAFRRDPALIEQIRYDSDFIANVERFTTGVTDAGSPQLDEIQAYCQANLDQSVTDPVLREKLQPSYRAACKRLIYSPDYYQAIQHPNAELVDDGIECIEPAGVRTRDGRLHELDVIALATGFNAEMFMRPMQVTGRNGADLNAFWAKRPTAYLAVSMPDFPNLFMLNGPTGPVGNFSLIDIAELQWGYIAQLIERVASGRCREISASREALDAYETRRIEAAKNTVFASGCNSWYLDAEGVPATWPWTHKRFTEEMARPNLDDYEQRP
ncbi:MAG: NAD(P)/FAD-dependent oxidoreductase [Oceanospirillaceae bacterium]|nr:NAD(P)/FAD-dependent oxidoreductase [Oceanospirillaceae bacterium]